MLTKTSADKMLGEVSELYDDAVSFFRTRRLDKTIENAALYRGWHLLTRDGANSTGGDPEGEASESITLARMIVKSAVAARLRQGIDFELPAAKDDQRSRAKADFTEKLGRSLLRTKLDRDELHRAVSWSMQTGGSWMKVCWDNTAGPVLPLPYDGLTDEEQAQYEQDDGFGEKAFGELFAGDIRCEFVPTTDGFPDPLAKTARDLHHFFHVKLLPVRRLQDRFPLDAFGEETANRWDIGTNAMEKRSYQAIAEDDDWLSGGGRKVNAHSNTLAELVEFWELPSRRYPRGRFLAFSGGLLVAAGPNPYYPARLPFVLFDGDNKVPGALYADGTIEDIKSQQANANRIASKLREHVDKILNVHLLVPFEAGIDKNLWGDRPGQIIPYRKGFKPEPLEVRDIPAGMFEYMNEQIERAKQLSGYSDLGRGQNNSDLSGRAVAFTTEREEATRGPDQASFATSMTKVAQHMVYLARQFYDDGRLIGLVGENGKIEQVEFQQDDFDWDNDFVPTFQADRPQSRAARISEIIEVATAKLFDDSPGAERARRMMGDDYAYASSVDPFAEDRQRAKRENLTALRNPMAVPQVLSYDTHKIHLQEHYKWMRTLEFEELPPEQKQSMFDHCELHELLAAAAGLVDPDNMAVQQQGAGQPPGPPPQTEPGTESPPSGGASPYPAPPPGASEFASMSESEQRSSDQA